MTAAVASLPRAPGLLEALLEALLSFLPQSKPAARIPNPPAELRPLIEIGRDALGARDLRDLHNRLDSHVMRMRDLRLPSPPDDSLPRDLPEEPRPGSLAERTLGLNVAGKLYKAFREWGALLPALAEVDKDIGSPRSVLAMRALTVRPWSLHDGQVVPHALIESALIQQRGVVALTALLVACIDARRPEPWLTNALADTYLETVREMARLLASAGYDVGPSKPESLLDLEALFRETEEADAAFVAGFDADIRAGLVGVPEDE